MSEKSSTFAPARKIYAIPMDHIAADDALFLLEHFLARPVVR